MRTTRLRAAVLLVAGVALTASGAPPSVAQGAKPTGSPGTTPASAAPAAKAAVAPEPAKPAKDLTPAKILFGGMTSAASLKARAIGFYSRGCLAGAKPLAIDGPAWQAMRLSRNRMWGHPELISWIERFAGDVKRLDGWPGLLVGDISQPRGGPMLTGHASHQIGLDADIWLTPMPDRRLNEKEREDLAASSMLAADKISVDPSVWTDAHHRLIKRAASYSEVERVLVHPAIKKALCEKVDTDKDKDKTWLAKVRPYWGHHYHMHVRMGCPDDSPDCTDQAAAPGDDGCGKELADWFALLTKPKVPAVKPKEPAPPPQPMTIDKLPAECRVVLNAAPSTHGSPSKAGKKEATAR